MAVISVPLKNSNFHRLSIDPFSCIQGFLSFRDNVHFACVNRDCYKLSGKQQRFVRIIRILNQNDYAFKDFFSRGFNFIHLIIKFRRIAEMHVLSQGSMDFNAKDRYKRNAYNICAMYNSLSAIPHLQAVKNPADIDNQDVDGSTPLMRAARLGHDQMVTEFIKLGANKYKQNNLGYGPATIAAKYGYVRVLASLHLAGIDMQVCNQHSHFPATVAAKAGKGEVLRFLARLCGQDLNASDDSGQSPATIAISKHQNHILYILYQVGVNLSMCNTLGNSPATTAADCGNLEALRILKNLGVDMTQPDLNLYTPATIAAMSGRASIVSQLGKWKVDLNEPDGHGYTPLWCAQKTPKRKQIIKVLSQFDVDTSVQEATY